MLDRLFEAARGEAPDTSRVEFAFETRLMARIREERSSSVSTWAWKLVPFFAVVVIVVSLWNRPTAAELNGTATMVADAVRQHPNRIFLSLVDRDH